MLRLFICSLTSKELLHIEHKTHGLVICIIYVYLCVYNIYIYIYIYIIYIYIYH